MTGGLLFFYFYFSGKILREEGRWGMMILIDVIDGRYQINSIRFVDSVK